MNFFDSVISAFKNYVNFSGRATRSEFWWFFLFCILLYMLTFSLSVEEFNGALSNSELQNGNPAQLVGLFIQSWFGVAFLVTFIPSITIAVRRFHDLNMSGWWYVGLQIAPSLLPSIFIFNLISLMALFLFVYFMAQEGGEDNRFGPNPYSEEI
jgi:uncharacterized membrane protein YhaH (DUF805 family)